jgi:hypothetical protein
VYSSFGSAIALEKRNSDALRLSLHGIRKACPPALAAKPDKAAKENPPHNQVAGLFFLYCAFSSAKVIPIPPLTHRVAKPRRTFRLSIS